MNCVYMDELITINDYLDRKMKNQSDEYISKQLYIGSTTLQNWKIRNKITNKDIVKRKYEIIKQHRNNGLSYPKIADIMNLNPNVPRRIVKRVEGEFSEKNS